MGQTLSMNARISPTHTLTLQLIDNKGDAEEMLNNAEQIDHYLEECNDDSINRRVRQSSVYAPNMIDYGTWTKMTEQIQQSVPWLPPRIRNELGSVHIIPLMPSAESGMPHTRPGRLICVPNMEQFTKTTLLHEIWHVHQREFHAWWTDVFREWGWTELVDTSILPASIESRRRYNPDTLDSPLWVYRGTWVPVPVLTGTTLSDAEIWFYNVTEKYHRRVLPDELREGFTGVSDIAFEHPRELSAYLLSEPRKYKNLIGFQTLMKLIGHLSLPSFP